MNGGLRESERSAMDQSQMEGEKTESNNPRNMYHLNICYENIPYINNVV